MHCYSVLDIAPHEHETDGQSNESGQRGSGRHRPGFCWSASTERGVPIGPGRFSL